jgi:hypothetical protein
VDEGGIPTACSLAAWTDHQPPHHVDHEPYGDKAYEYLYWSYLY